MEGIFCPLRNSDWALGRATEAVRGEAIFYSQHAPKVSEPPVVDSRPPLLTPLDNTVALTHTLKYGESWAPMHP